MRRCAVVFAMLALSGCFCAQANRDAMSRMEAERQFYYTPRLELAKVPEETKQAVRGARAETKFSVPAAERAAAMGRAQVFLAQFSSMKIQTATDFVVETYSPPILRYGYRIVAAPSQDGSTITIEVSAFHGTSRDPKGEVKLLTDDVNNAAIAAHYIRTGENLCAECIAR